MAGWSTTKSISGGDKKPYLKDEIEMAEFTNEYKSFRLVGPITSYAETWNEFSNPKTGKSNKFPKICLDYDRDKGEFTKDICPYRKAGLYISQRFVTNLIDRELQEEKRKGKEPLPAETKKRDMLGEQWCFKNRGSKTRTFYRGWDLPVGCKDKIAALTELWHKRRVKAAKGKKVKKVELSDPEFGCDLLIKFDSKAKGPNKWDIQLEDPTPLTKRELNTPLQNLNDLKSLEPEKLEVAKKEWEGLKKRLIVRDKEGKIVKSKIVEDDEEEDEDEDLEEKPKKKKKVLLKNKKKSSSGKIVPPWDTDDEEKPKKKKLKTKKSSLSSGKKKKLSKSLDDDLEDIDD